MKDDDAATLVTGIILHHEIQRQNNEARQKQQRENEELGRQNDDLSAALKKQKSKLAAVQADLEDDVETLQHQNALLFQKAKELQAAVDAYQLLLCKPMADIAQQNGNFKETYDKNMELMAEWMVSQKAFKELALELGLKLGISAEEIIRLGNDKKAGVLGNRHNPKHGSNASDVPLIGQYAERLSKKFAGGTS